MSIIRISLRLEIPDESLSPLPKFQFNCDTETESDSVTNHQSDSNKTLIATVTNQNTNKFLETRPANFIEGVPEEIDSNAELKQIFPCLSGDPVVFIGQRKYCKISIETYMAEKLTDGSLFDTIELPPLVNPEDNGKKLEETVSSLNKPTVSKEDHQPKQKSQKEHTISGALKNPLSKSRSLDYGNTDIPHAGKILARTTKDSAACFNPVNLDLEEARARGAQCLIQDPESLTFFSGNPSVETTEGIIHLYKDNEPIKNQDSGRRGQLICMLHVPTTLTSQDLIQFVGPVASWIEHFKIIRDATPNYYMTLLKFDSQEHADEFYKNFNGKTFNSIEPAVCHLVYVARLETVKSSNGASLPIPGMTELPICPVCLERMDESVDGILTILCNHSFHTSCLSHWDDTSCPVCRYTQTPESVADNKCFECNSDKSLWICLICGYVGCGRYVEGHAFRHFQETNHTFSMQLGSNRVWDYAGDNYVHRLVMNKSDGKMIQVGEDGIPIENEEKLDSITLEYTYLLNTQLESQRHYFEDKLLMVEKEATIQLTETELAAKEIKDKCRHLEDFLSTEIGKRKTSEKKCELLSEKYRTVLNELSEEKEMNKNLCENQMVLKQQLLRLEDRLQHKDEEIAELREQLRDVMLFLDAQQKLSATEGVSKDEIENSTVSVATNQNAKKSRKKGR